VIDAESAGGTRSDRVTRKRPRPRLTPTVVSGLAAAVGVAAIVGGYLGSTAPNPLASGAMARPPKQVADASGVVRGAYQPERGPFGLPWVWLSDQGSLAVQNASGRIGYVGVLATSLRRPRAVRIGGSPQRFIGTAPRAYLIGPFRLISGAISIRVSPGADRVSPADPRRTSVFLSTPVVSRMPFAAIPTRGFYPAEQADDRRFNWMTERGVLDLVAPPAVDRVAAVRLRMWSATPRSVRIERADAATSKTVSLAARRVQSVVVGGIQMRSGRGRLILSTEAPTPSRRDSRRLALQLLGVTRVE